MSSSAGVLRAAKKSIGGAVSASSLFQVNGTVLTQKKALLVKDFKALDEIVQSISRITGQVMQCWENSFTATAQKNMTSYLNQVIAKQKTLGDNLEKYLNIVLEQSESTEKKVTSNADLFDN